jgi:hypothetical protein
MPRHTRNLCILIAALTALVHAQMPPHAPQYKIAAQLPLALAEDHIEGRIQILEDARLTPALLEKLWGMGDIDFDEDPQLIAFKAEPLRNAEVRLTTRAGTTTGAIKLERPLARLKSTQLYATPDRTFLITVDYSAGFGSYNGPITLLLEVRNGRLEWLKATEQTTGKKYQITLMQSLKTVWKIVPSTRAEGKEILLASCRPDWDSPTFKHINPSVKSTDRDFWLIYTRYFFNGTNWVEVERRRHGFADFEEGLPSRSKFP